MIDSNNVVTYKAIWVQTIVILGIILTTFFSLFGLVRTGLSEKVDNTLFEERTGSLKELILDLKSIANDNQRLNKDLLIEFEKFKKNVGK